MVNLPPIHRFLPLVFEQLVRTQSLPRPPEPSSVTADPQHVLEYDQVMSTKLAIAYAIVLEIIYRARTHAGGGSAMDLACGPGQFSLLMLRHLNLEKLVGIDLAGPMVEAARLNAVSSGLTQANFQHGDAMDLSGWPDDSFELCTFTDAAHHLPSLDRITELIRGMDRVTRPDGLLIVSDLARLRSSSLTQRYVETLAGDYRSRGLSHFLEDFRNSMYAAWTTKELRSAVPADVARQWYHVYPRELPTIQVLIGIPPGRSKLYVRKGYPWSRHQHPLNSALLPEWRLMRLSMAVGVKKRLRLPGRAERNTQGRVGTFHRTA